MLSSFLILLNALPSLLFLPPLTSQKPAWPVHRVLEVADRWHGFRTTGYSRITLSVCVSVCLPACNTEQSSAVWQWMRGVDFSCSCLLLYVRALLARSYVLVHSDSMMTMSSHLLHIYARGLLLWSPLFFTFSSSHHVSLIPPPPSLPYPHPIPHRATKRTSCQRCSWVAAPANMLISARLRGCDVFTIPTTILVPVYVCEQVAQAISQLLRCCKRELNLIK